MVTNDETAATAEPTRYTNVRTFDGKEFSLEHPKAIQVFVSYDASGARYVPGLGLSHSDATVYGEAKINGRLVRCSVSCDRTEADDEAERMFAYLTSLVFVATPF